MKKIKRGFSLAEVLISTAIISIIATMGFTIAKRGIENAYKLYYYTGYKGISDAIADTLAQGISFEFSPYESNRRLNTFAIEHIAEILTGNGSEVAKASAIDGGYQNSNNLIIAPNNISYTFRVCSTRKNLDTNMFHDDILIKMTIPRSKTGDKATESACFIYYPRGYLKPNNREVVHYGILMPVNGGFYECQDVVPIADRMDLLPFYIDDGLVGRVSLNTSGQPTYKKREFLSFTQAKSKFEGEKRGVIKVAHPSQVK